MSRTPHRLTSVGRPQNLLLANPPASGWHLAADWATWKDELPNAYTYRLRAVNAAGVVLWIDDDHEYALLYVGETGIKNNDPSYRGEKLSRGAIDQAFGTGVGAHSGAKTFWNDDWDTRLKAIDLNYHLEFGWDEHVEETIFANKDERLPVSQQKDQTITNSGKGLAMNLEDKMIREYEARHRRPPPLNSINSPGLRDRDRKSKHGVAQDTKDIG